jgi:hypothetical protein
VESVFHSGSKTPPICTIHIVQSTSPLAPQWPHGLCPGAGGPICPGISCAPSAFSLSNVLFLWYSITLLFLKYVTCPAVSFIIIVAGHIVSSLLPVLPPFARQWGRRTQLLAQLVSNPLPSTEHAFSALSFSVMLSTILFRSKQPKYASLASQHLARCVRSGAIGAPSEEIFGGGGEAGEELNNPMSATGSFKW